jgi:hypothetical protein
MCRYCRRKYDSARRSARRRGNVIKWADIVASAKDSAIASAAVAGLRAFNGTAELAKALVEALIAYPPGSFGRARLLMAIMRLHMALPAERLDMLSNEDLDEKLRRCDPSVVADVLREMQPATDD